MGKVEKDPKKNTSGSFSWQSKYLSKSEQKKDCIVNV